MAALSETITVNGEPRQWRAQSVQDLLAGDGLAIDKGGLAVALNANVVPRAEWPATAVSPDDSIEIIQIVRGG